jgi:hypothetical protein
MSGLTNPASPNPQFYDSDFPLEPTRLRQGDSWNWIRAFPDYPSALYTLTYILNSASNRFVLLSTGATPPITPDDSGQAFVIQATAVQTAACQPDTYSIAAVLSGIAGTTAQGQQETLVLQDVIVDPNLATAVGPVDTRSNCKKNLDAINTCLLNNADPSVQEYMINGRQLRRFSRADLLKEREYWKNEYRAELRASGQYTQPRGIGFRFTATSS